MKSDRCGIVIRTYTWIFAEKALALASLIDECSDRWAAKEGGQRKNRINPKEYCQVMNRPKGWV